MQLLRKLDDWLNGITMYRLLLYGLGLLAAIGIVFSLIDVILLPSGGLVISLAVLVAVCYSVNRLLAYFYGVAVSSESSLITALILFCILPPPTDVRSGVIIGLAGLIAMVSKYVVTIRRSHIFNPAAIAAMVVGLLGLVHASWWVGTASLLPFTLLLGLLIVRKIRRFRLLGSFLLASLVLMLLLAIHHGQPLGHSLVNAFTSWPLVFFGTIMLTEPATMPATDSWRLAYGLLTGLLFAAQLKVGPLYTTPEMALVLGNLFAFAISPRQTLLLRLKEKRQLAPRVYDFIFEPDRRSHFTAGQYLQLTLPHRHVDGRGNRRTFTIASSPTERLLHLGIKFYEPSSSFKRCLQAVKVGDVLQVGQFAGDFSLPKDPSVKVVFIAGGIGVTPFRSMLQYLIDTKQLRDIVLFYVVSEAAELVYQDVLDKARAYGLKVVPLVSTRITKEILLGEVPDYASRTYYVSGPNAMVEAYSSQLQIWGVTRRQLHTDHFSGY